MVDQSAQTRSGLAGIFTRIGTPAKCPNVHRLALAAMVSAIAAPTLCWAANITMHHYDNLRTGWNQNETVLTPASLANSSFGVVATATVDGQIDAQPLVVQALHIAGQGKHDVVFVATENNSIYALDAYSGAVLLKVNLGPSVPPSKKPKHYQQGIQSTPVIDVAAGVMYAISYTLESGNPVYRVHALNLTTLADELPSTVVAAVNELDNDTQIQFDPQMQRQRPALLESGGNIYAAFGSFGDTQDLTARGWLLGWNAATLAPLVPNMLTNHRASAITCGSKRQVPCFLSSIWMSGAGVAADTSGNLYVITGNSEMGTYDGIDNIQQTAIKISPDLTTVLDEFTPWNVTALDGSNLDFGSGGITLLPDQTLTLPHLAVAAGKSGTLYLLNRDQMGGHTQQAPDNVPGEYKIGPCWCQQSYFTGSDGSGRIVSSGGRKIEIWKLAATHKSVALKLQSTSAVLETGQDPGFLTSVSSNGTTADTAVVWAVARPQTEAGTLTLYAFDASTAASLVSIDAGTWPESDYNANVVPVVANGRVYVAGGSHLTVFGLNAANRKGPRFSGPDAAAPPPVDGHEIYGLVESTSGNEIGLKLRNGAHITVDAQKAIHDDNASPRIVGEAIGVDGSYDSRGVFHAEVVFRAKQSSALWPSDQ
jgi:hypothetical protein